MDAATDIASKAADTFLQQGILGALVVVLAIALVGAVVVMRRDSNREREQHDKEIAAKDDKISALHDLRLEDTKAAMNSITASVKTVETAIGLLQTLGRK